eukprot:6678524-Karenia_brevis.AAC.1
MITGFFNGSVEPPEDFKIATCVCLPQTSGIEIQGHLPVHDPKGTRLLSIVDAANSIVAWILPGALERCT